MSEIANAHAQGVLTQSKQAISDHAQELHAVDFSPQFLTFGKFLRTKNRQPTA